VSAAPLIEVTGVSRSYRRGPESVHALAGARLALEPGELVALVGPSGSGKTTLLNVLAGWERADAGEVVWRGRRGVDLAGLPWSEMAVVPQRLGLLDELSVRENVELPLRLSGSLEETGSGHAAELLGRLRLDHLADRPPSETSLGEQQRTALARAILPRPRVLLADEPAGHQDVASAESVFRALRAVSRNGTCCLVATHNRDSLRFCDRALEMADGRVTDAEWTMGAL
jgi:putative ABC transport system ATP-binding protein